MAREYFKTHFPRDSVPVPGLEVFVFVKNCGLNPRLQNGTRIR